ESAITQAIVEAERPFHCSPGDIEEVREALLECMWEDVGIVRDGTGLARAEGRLSELDSTLMSVGMASQQRAYNLTWHDWLNLSNLILVSRAIQSSAAHREESLGAHYRADFPDHRPAADSVYVTVRFDGSFRLDQQPVRFSRVRPGQSLLAC
nr:succinate dehydrogenase/fumarate reductase flavoprotein subunit [Burkholderiaceae bacterium]